MQKNKKPMGNKVVVGDMPLAVALRKFQQKVKDSGVLDAVRENAQYEKPTTTRKRAKGAARARWLKKLRDQELPKKLF
jgi:small subunit ribosomal protein S21